MTSPLVQSHPTHPHPARTTGWLSHGDSLTFLWTMLTYQIDITFSLRHVGSALHMTLVGVIWSNIGISLSKKSGGGVKCDGTGDERQNGRDIQSERQNAVR